MDILIECKAGFEDHEIVEFAEAGAYAVYKTDDDGTLEFLDDFADYSDAVDFARAQDPTSIGAQWASGSVSVTLRPEPAVDLRDIAEVEEWLNS